MFDFYKKPKYLKPKFDCVIPSKTGKTIQVRTDADLNYEFELYQKELLDLGFPQDISKIGRDIWEDFFLTRKLKRQQYELEDI